MAIVKTQVANYTGYRAGIRFSNGKAKCTDPYLLSWFEEHGYIVEYDDNEEKPDQFTLMTAEEIRDYIIDKGFGMMVRNTKNKDKLIKMARDIASGAMELPKEEPMKPEEVKEEKEEKGDK